MDQQAFNSLRDREPHSPSETKSVNLTNPLQHSGSRITEKPGWILQLGHRDHQLHDMVLF